MHICKCIAILNNALVRFINKLGSNSLARLRFLPEEFRDGTGSICTEFRRVDLLSLLSELFGGQNGSARRSCPHTPGVPAAPGAGAVRGERRPDGRKHGAPEAGALADEALPG